jgi:3-carboxy-cis,cis-muconate cycloisomerase
VVPVILAAMQQEHERAAGGWQAEWAAIPDLFCYTSGAVEGVRGAVAGLEIDAARMKVNLDMTGGLIMAEALTMALASKVGRPEAYRITQAACKQVARSGKNLRQVVMEDGEVRAVLSPGEVDNALDPVRYLGSTEAFIDRAIAAYSEMEKKHDRGNEPGT